MSEKDTLIVPKFDRDCEHWAILMENLLRSKEWWELVKTGSTRPERNVILIRVHSAQLQRLRRSSEVLEMKMGKLSPNTSPKS